MSLTVSTDGSEVQINVQTIGCTFTFKRPTGATNDAAAVADVIRRAISDLTAADNRAMWEERDRRIHAERAVTSLRGRVTRLKNRLAQGSA